MKEGQFWKVIREQVSIMTKEGAIQYKELWIPGFKIETKNSSATSLLKGNSLGDKEIINVRGYNN